MGHLPEDCPKGLHLGTSRAANLTVRAAGAAGGDSAAAGVGRGGDRPEPGAGPPEAGPPGEGPAEESRDDPFAPPRRPRPASTRRRPEPEPEPEEVLTEIEPAETEEDFDDGPEDNLADLNVPSWADLIASLYRPER